VGAAAGALGGNGGTGTGSGQRGGDGGAASAVAEIATANPTGTDRFAEAIGGDGGGGLDGADGGHGGAASSDLTVTDSTPEGTTGGGYTLSSQATGGKGGASDGGTAGDGGDADAALSADLTGQVAVRGDVWVAAKGGSSSGGRGGDGTAQLGLVQQSSEAASGVADAIGGDAVSGGVGGDAIALVGLVHKNGERTSGYASASGGQAYLGPGTGGSAVALASSEGGTVGFVDALARAGDLRGTVVVATASSAAGTGTAGAGAAVGEADPGFFDLLDSAAADEGSNIHVGIAAPDLSEAAAAAPVALSAPLPQTYGVGLISVLSGGTGTMIYAGSARFTFRAGATESLFLDFALFGTSSLFDNLSFSASLNGTEVVNESFDKPASAQDFFGRQHALGFGRDKIESDFLVTYSFMANAPDQGFSTLYTLSNIPVAPIPVPAALPLLLGALAGLAGLRLRARRTGRGGGAARTTGPDRRGGATCPA